MTKKEMEVSVLPAVQEQMTSDPVLGELVRDITSRLRQALHGVDPDDHEAVEKAMRSVGAQPLELDDALSLDDDDLAE